MRKKLTLSLFIVLLSLVIVSMGFSQQPIKIGVVNSQKVLENSIEGKKVMAQMEERNQKSQDELARFDDEINRLQTRLNTQRLTLTAEAYSNLASELEKKQTDRKRMAEDSYREMQELSQRLFARLQNDLLPIINEIGKEKNLDVIFDLMRSGAIYFSPTIDLTDEVITKFDAAKSK
jgi:Skp family chaperone for outer membrane proteins